MSAEKGRQVLAPAKVNLCLRVVGQRADGYHLLDSLMVPVDLYDELVVSVRPDSSVRVQLVCQSPGVPADRSNLTWRAAELFLQRSGLSAAVEIHLSKQIPVGSGLGGGSSDAAAILTSLNRLLGTRRDAAELACWGLELGADVPFFVHGRPARVEGIGEIVTPLPGWERIALVIAFPGVGFSTRMVYQQFDLRRARRGVSLTNQALASSIPAFAGSGRPLRELLVNDLEAVAAEGHPELLSLKKLLAQLGAEGMLMTGSGSAVFGVWPSRPAAEEAAVALRGRGTWAVAAETLELSPAAA